jgi:hypothetical protein
VFEERVVHFHCAESNGFDDGAVHFGFIVHYSKLYRLKQNI